MAQSPENPETMVVDITGGKKIYFASDLHLGIPTREKSREREKAFVQWLSIIEKDAALIVLAGDLFDFWFEYKHVVPRGYVRLLGKLAELREKGIGVWVFKGNHDMWMKQYLVEECGVKIFDKNVIIEAGGKKTECGHGDGLGPGDKGYKFIKKMFGCRFLQWLYARFHPNFAFGLALFFSKSSRLANEGSNEEFQGEDQEYIVRYIKGIPEEKRADYYVFGHRHLPLDLKIGKAQYINLGEWVHHRTYGVFDGEMRLEKFEI